MSVERDVLIAGRPDTGFPLPRVLQLVAPEIFGVIAVTSTDAWGAILREIFTTLPHWTLPCRRLLSSGKLAVLASTLDMLQSEGVFIRAPLPERIFRAYAEIPLNRVRVVFLGQDPYPTADKSATTLKKINKLPHDKVVQILGEGYDTWEMVEGTPWPNEVENSLLVRPKVRIGAVPYAIGKSFAYPRVCEKAPGSYENLQAAVRIFSPQAASQLDPELNRWSDQGVLMLNACPMLYGNGASAKNPNVWTAWTSTFLETIAQENPYCAFVLLGNSAKVFKPEIIGAHPQAFIIETGHPSKRSSSKDAFLNADVFGKINAFFGSLATSIPNSNIHTISW